MKHLEVFCKRQCNGHFWSPTPGSSHCIETTLRLSRGGSYADDPTLWPLQTVEDVSPVARQLIDIDTLHTLYLYCIKHLSPGLPCTDISVTIHSSSDNDYSLTYDFWPGNFLLSVLFEIDNILYYPRCFACSLHPPSSIYARLGSISAISPESRGEAGYRHCRQPSPHILM